MADYGKKAILSSAFGGAKKMHSGKNFPQNFRGWQMVLGEMLRPYIRDITLQMIWRTF